MSLLLPGSDAFFPSHSFTNQIQSLLDTIYPSKFTDETPMSMHDLRVSPGRTYRYYQEPLFAFGTGLTLTEWRVTGTAPACLASLSTAAPEQSCNVSLTVEERVADLVSRIQPEEKAPLLTARESPLGGIPRLGLPEYDWGNC